MATAVAEAGAIAIPRQRKRPLHSVQQERHFMETTALTRVDFEGARKRTGRGDAGGFNKSSLTDNQPEIVF